jgi:cupin 2 domain-containing protein
MAGAHGNLFDDVPASRAEEHFTDLLKASGLRIERIVSHGQASPPGFWYDQEKSEWVVVIKGAASLQFENDSEARVLKPGDYLLIPAHTRHRVAWTAPEEPTIWLAVHFR